MKTVTIHTSEGRADGDWGERFRRCLRAVPFRLGLALLGFALGMLLTGLACSRPPSWERELESIRRAYPSVRHIQTEELESRLESRPGERPFVIDARSREEYRVSHLPGAVNVPLDSDYQATLAGIAKERAIVVYCSVGYRSSELAERLSELGFRDVVNLEGSIFKWANEGRPLVRGGVPADKVHPFDERWGALLDPDLRAPLPEASR